MLNVCRKKKFYFVKYTSLYNIHRAKLQINKSGFFAYIIFTKEQSAKLTLWCQTCLTLVSVSCTIIYSGYFLVLDLL